MRNPRLTAETACSWLPPLNRQSIPAVGSETTKGLWLLIEDLILSGWLVNDFTTASTDSTFSLFTVGKTTRSPPSLQSLIPIIPTLI